MMSDASDSRTRVSLLARVCQNPDDQVAWNEFVSRYSPKIDRWCRRWGLQEADAQDVTQMVLLQLATKMRRFAYDPTRSFRAWLKTLTQHAWSDFVAARQRAVTATGDSQTMQALGTLEARQDLEMCLEEAFDLELMELATLRVREQVEPRTWDAFRLTALDGWSGAQAAAHLGMQVDAVFKAKSNVKKRLQEAVRQLERPESV
jgi:RNA polymerase sigma-70 factor (ECF subfamily)